MRLNIEFGLLMPFITTCVKLGIATRPFYRKVRWRRVRGFALIYWEAVGVLISGATGRPSTGKCDIVEFAGSLSFIGNRDIVWI